MLYDSQINRLFTNKAIGKYCIYWYLSKQIYICVLILPILDAHPVLFHKYLLKPVYHWFVSSPSGLQYLLVQCWDVQTSHLEPKTVEILNYSTISYEFITWIQVLWYKKYWLIDWLMINTFQDCCWFCEDFLLTEETREPVENNRPLVGKVMILVN